MSHVQRAKTDFCGRLLSYIWSRDLILWDRHELCKHGNHIFMNSWCSDDFASACVWMSALSGSDLTSADSWQVYSLSCHEKCASRRSEFRLALGCWTAAARMAHGVFQECWLEDSAVPVTPNEVEGLKPSCCMVCWDVCCGGLLCNLRDCTAHLRNFVVFAYARWCLQDVVCADVLGQVSLAMITLLRSSFEKIDQDRLFGLAD